MAKPAPHARRAADKNQISPQMNTDQGIASNAKIAKDRRK
jgi:hypothetical protein